MKNQTRRHIRRINKAQRQRHYVVAVFACVALVLATGVAFALRGNGRAATHQEQVLSCPVTGTVAHTHDGNCYDADGNLVCTLPEVEYHVHDDSCYSEETTLVCGLEEGEEHVHTDACYQTERTLVCGKDEVTEAHQHGAGCFETVEVADSMPEQAFEHRFVDGDNKEVLNVFVDAPEGSLPEGSTMEAKWVDTAKKKNAEVKAVIEEAVAKKTDAEIAEVHAVDITFRDAEGNEVEPAKKVTVTMASPQIADQDIQQLLVHVESDREAQERAERAGESTYQIEGSVIEPLTARQLKKRDLPDEADELVFDADQFSVYAIAYTVDFHYDVDGESYDYTLQGGDSVSLRELLQGMKVFKAKDADKFMAEVKDVTFSDTSLLAVAHVEEATTAGVLRERLGLQAQHSSELTEEQVAEMDAKQFKKGDWALLSLRPFTSDEKLTVTMNNGDVLTVRVTDAQISTLYLSDSGELYEVTVTYDETAGIPEGSRLRVTEFDEGAAEYEHARNAVLADKKARGEWVDLNCFGLAALDISILNPEGTEIEPQAPVQVDIRIKELPGVEDLSEVADTLAIQHHVEVGDGVVVETVYDGSAEVSFRLNTDEAVAAEGTVVDPNAVSEDDFAAPAPEMVGDLNVEFEAACFSTFTISWNNAYGNGTKIHYVDESGRELTVKNTSLPKTIGENSADPAYLIYDIEGYEYSYTYYNNKNTKIYPYLFQAFGWSWGTYYYGWAYYDSYGRGTLLDDKKDIYVVYKKKADIPQGGTPTVSQSGSAEPPVAPRINKESTPNGDDTNTLALSLISDTAQLEVEKLADVIVVFDVSGSMTTKDMGGKSRLEAAEDAVNKLAEHLAQKTNSDGKPLVRMSLIQFSTKADTVLGMTELTTEGPNNGLSQIKSAVSKLRAVGGTNWDHALQLANAENDLDDGRATFVIFVTDGDPTFRNTRMDVTDSQLQEETNNQSGEYNPYYLGGNVYGPGDNDKTGQCYAAAVQQGKAIVAAGKNIYTIGISNDVKKVDSFNSDIGGNGAYLAADSGALQQAFEDIEASISGAAGWGNIQMTDGITSLTNTVQKTGLTKVGGDFTYWIAPAPENWASMTKAEKNAYKPNASDFREWDPEAAGAALAQYNSQTGAVEWNMGSTFMPEAGVTYQVRFKVWPSQEAYDYIAKLNNGTITYDKLPADVRAQIQKKGNTYTLKTNESDAKTTYQAATKTGNIRRQDDGQ